MFDLEFDGLTNELGLALAHACADRGAWPVAFSEGRVEKRWFGIEKAYPPVLDIQAADGTGSILAVTAERDADTIDLRHDAIPRLVDTVRILGEHLPEGFVFRATHSGSPIQRDATVSVEGLATLIADGHLNEFTRYLVR
jgi:hypothetical protein